MARGLVHGKLTHASARYAFRGLRWLVVATVVGLLGSAGACGKGTPACPAGAAYCESLGRCEDKCGHCSSRYFCDDGRCHDTCDDCPGEPYAAGGFFTYVGCLPYCSSKLQCPAADLPGSCTVDCAADAGD